MLERRRKWPDIEIDRLHAGLVLDRLIALHVFGWQEWQPGHPHAMPTFVVHPVTGAIERCLQEVWSCGGPEYPECASSYHFSTDERSAAEVYRLLPARLQDWRLTPLEICKTALRWQQQLLAGTAA